MKLLDDAAQELYKDDVERIDINDLRPSAQINDKFGVNAVLSMFDWAIKERLTNETRNHRCAI